MRYAPRSAAMLLLSSMPEMPHLYFADTFRRVFMLSRAAAAMPRYDFYISI